MAIVRQETVIRRFVQVGIVAPVALTLVTFGFIVAWRSRLPHPIATHWGASGGPDRFGSLASTLALTLIVGLGMPALVAATSLPHLRRGARGANTRAIAAIVCAVVTMICVVNVWTVGMQRGLADAHDGPSALPAVWAGLGLGVIAGIAGWFVQPRQSAVVPGLTHATPLELAPHERAVWMRTASMARGFVVLMAAILAGLACTSVAMWVAGDAQAAAIFFGSFVLVALAMAATSVFHVTVDESGLSAVSALGVPRVHVALDEVADAGVAPVDGFGEFGGWGFRQRPGALGIILRNGESLQVTRRNGKTLVITVDDAGTAAALLMALSRRVQNGAAAS